MLHQDNMKLLTIGTSPFYFTRNSKIHDTIISEISSSVVGEIILSSILLEHDIEYFPQEKIQSRYGDIDGTFYGVNLDGDALVTNMFDIIEKESPDVILSIGGFCELEHTRAIRRVMPDSFSWIVVLTSNITEHLSMFSETLMESDHIICLTEQSYNSVKLLGVDCSLFKYGIDELYMSSLNEDKKDITCPTFIINDKNVQQSNLALVLDTFSLLEDSNFKIILHTNYYESGDYDLDYLISKFNIGQIELPGDFVGIRDGLSDSDMIKQYSRAHFVIDISIKPITSLCVLEGMSQGCVPIINKSGSLYEEIENNDKYSVLQDFLVENNLFFGEHLEPFYMASQDSFFDKIRNGINMINEKTDTRYSRASSLSKFISNNIFYKGFCQKVGNLIINGNFNTEMESKLKLENS